MTNMYYTFILVLLQIIFGYTCILLTIFNEYIHNYIIMHNKELIIFNIIIWIYTIIHIEYNNVKTLFSLLLYTIYGSFTLSVCAVMCENYIINIIH